MMQNEPPERGGGHIARGPARVHREFIRCGAQRRAARCAAASDETASARRRYVRGAPRRGRVGKRIRLVPVQRAARRARPRGAFLRLVHRVERLTERVFFPFPSCFVGDVLVVGRPSIRLCNYASDGVGRRSLPHVLSHQRRRLCRTIQRFTSRCSRYRLIARGGRGGPIAPDASPCAHSNLKITPSTGNRVPLCARLRSGQS